MKKILNIQGLCIVAILLLPILGYAQAGFGDDVNDTPIDGGLSLLVAAGVGYGVKKVKNIRKDK